VDDKKYALPINVETEKFVLGSAMVDGGEKFPSLGLVPEHFGLEKHRTILAAMNALDASGSLVGRVEVCNELLRTGKLESVDGMAYVISLDEGLPVIWNLDGWIKILEDYRIRRQLIFAAKRIEEMAILGTDETSGMIERAVSTVNDLATSSQTEYFPAVSRIIQEHGGINGWLAEGAALAMKTGYPALDEVTGGLIPSDFWVVAGPTGGGKSTFTRNIAVNLATAGFPGAIISLEMKPREIVDGFNAIHSRLNLSDLRRKVVSDREAFRSGMAFANELPIHIEYRKYTIPAIRSHLLRLKNKSGCRWAIVDFLQLMQSTTRVGSREQEVAGFAYGLRNIAMELDMAIIGISQLSREHAKLKRKPELSDLRESGSIEFSATHVAFVWSEYQPEKMQFYPAEILIRKQRAGQNHVDILFDWEKHCGRFIERGQA
jgi:replicative DNA helicase